MPIHLRRRCSRTGSNMVDRWGEHVRSGHSDQRDRRDSSTHDVLKTPMILEVQLDEEVHKYEREMEDLTGIVKEDDGRGYETSEGLMVSTATLKDIIEKATGQPQTKITYSGMNVKVTDISLVADVEKSIKDMGYNTWSMSSMREELEKSSRQIQLLPRRTRRDFALCCGDRHHEYDDHVDFRENSRRSAS